MRFHLPSGRVVTIGREATGRDVEKAFSAAGSLAGNPATYAMALFSQVADVDEKSVVYEEVREFPYQDVMVIMAWSSGGTTGLLQAGISVSNLDEVGAGAPL